MLRNLLGRILNEWPTATKQVFTEHPLAQLIRNDFRKAVLDIISPVYPSFTVSSSPGAGNWANVPWLSILNPDITTTTQEGVYPVYVFCADGSGVYLSLNQGTTNPQKNLGKVAAEKHSDELAHNIRAQIPGLAEWGTQNIDLKATTPLGNSYAHPNIAAKFYPANSLPSEQELITDLFQLLGFYAQLKTIWTKVNSPLSIQSMRNLFDMEKRAQISTTRLPKPFLLLAGISGTGKTRFVRQQAAAHGGGNLSNYCLIPVRPDWHEPSDLLGYVSRLGSAGARYVTTELLRFLVAAWRDVWQAAEGEILTCKVPAEMTPYWLCLDEMNLAPVEQYFADYLAVIETRSWADGQYRCDALLKPAVLAQLDAAGKEALRNELGLADASQDDLWTYFCAYGIPLPPNLIVAGTVNMDETTHGFSRKVIDRAYTVDFGAFFPNDFAEYFAANTRPKTLSFPVLSAVSHADLVAATADPDGALSVAFLNAVNAVLRGSPFELAFRALNELLLAVVCFAPQDAAQLQAVWDDFLMTKVLPRIDGDAEKLRFDGADSLLIRLQKVAAESISVEQRPDLLREGKDGMVQQVARRADAKLSWMQERLAANGFTSFWP